MPFPGAVSHSADPGLTKSRLGIYVSFQLNSMGLLGLAPGLISLTPGVWVCGRASSVSHLVLCPAGPVKLSCQLECGSTTHPGKVPQTHTSSQQVRKFWTRTRWARSPRLSSYQWALYSCHSGNLVPRTCPLVIRDVLLLLGVGGKGKGHCLMAYYTVFKASSELGGCSSQGLALLKPEP